MEKYLKALSEFSQAPSDKAVSQTVTDIIAEHFATNNSESVRKFLHSCLDLTSLNPQDSKESIWKFIEKVNLLEEERPDIKNVAAVCVYPNFTAIAKEALTAGDVKIATVAGGFPSSQTFIEVKVAETALAVAEGADEIDVVLNLGAFFDKDYEELCEEIQELREVCRDKTLKVILETGILKSSQHIRDAAILSIYSGADFIKTSTGKNCEGATLEAVYVMCAVIREYYELYKKKIGIKVAGGVRTAEEAIKYYTLVKEILGTEWLNPKLFRIGASALAEELKK